MIGPVLKSVSAAILYLLAGPSLIILNKRLLTQLDFHYPMVLGSIGLGFSFLCTFAALQCGYVKPTVKISWDFFFRRVMVIGFAQACTFKFGMQAYLHLSVAFIQMMKSITPATTMTALSLLGKIPPSDEVMAVVVICGGTLMAAYGEMQLTMIGLMCVCLSEVAECARLVMTQLLLTDMKFSIVDALLYITPCGFFWLMSGALVFEYDDMVQQNAYVIFLENIPLFFAAAVLGLIVNTAGFLVIQTSGAVAIKVLGTARNAGLILFCFVFLGEKITGLEAMGYTIALSAFSYYSLLQIRKQQQAQTLHKQPEIRESALESGKRASSTE
eukprot:m.253930 g.253930  ORF g.253930 m.253930 type:complete len:329 (+) comp19598_c1_seq4:354-1340(+)